jgi:hypothetical protein
MQNAILAGPCLGELWWCFERFAPHVFWKKKELEKQYGKILLICLERPDRFDVWGRHADILVPLVIEEDETTYKQNCFRLDRFPDRKYEEIIRNFRLYYETGYNILEHTYPILSQKQFANKCQFARDQKLYEFIPRLENKLLLDEYLKTDKLIVTVAARFRDKVGRNWNGWQEFYNTIFSNKYLMKTFSFVICGKNPNCVPDNQDRFYDINKIKLGKNSSTIGLAIELLRQSVLTIGSQSGIPNISLLLGTETLEWGHQKNLHTLRYNVRKTPVTFIEDVNYSIPVRKVVEAMIKILKVKEKEAWKRKDMKTYG